MLRRIWTLTQKEFIQVFRDRLRMMLTLTMPLLELTIFALAIHTDVKHIPIAVADQSMSVLSRSYLNAMIDSEYFDVVVNASSENDLRRALDSGQASLGVLVPPDFADAAQQGEAKVLLLIDGSDSFTAQSAYAAANAISQQYAVSLTSQSVRTPLVAHIQILYNPDLKDLWFVIPGLIATLLQTQALALTALGVAREREMGTIEALLVTPIRPFELMLAKAIPSLCIALFNMASILTVGTLIFGVPFQGNVLLFVVLCTLYALSGLGLGLAISSVSQSQMHATQLTVLISFVSLFLSGFLFPTSTLPLPLRGLSYLIPLTYFIPIARGIFTKGIGIAYLWGPVLALVLLLGGILCCAAYLFRQRLD